MTARWELALAFPLLISATLLLASQGVFLSTSIRLDLGYGDLAPGLSWANYARVLGDGFYLRVLWLSVQVSAAAAAVVLIVGFPTAYCLARMPPRRAGLLISAILFSAFVTIVIKIYGLMIIFSADGPLNRFLAWSGLTDHPVTIVGTAPGVVLGLVYFSFGFAVLLLYGVVRTIPRSLEDAAAIHGASRFRVMARVVLPLALPGLIVAFLTVFNLCMGAFTSAALLGGGKVLTFPVLIQRTILTEVKYGVGGALAAVLLASVIAMNLLATVGVRRLPAARRLAST